jgi:hypothetical protein
LLFLADYPRKAAARYILFIIMVHFFYPPVKTAVYYSYLFFVTVRLDSFKSLL